MNREILVMFILLAVQAITAEDYDYCGLKSCPNRTHTLCQYPDPGASSRCGNVVRRGLTDNQKRIVLNVSNRNRPSVTLYEESENAQPYLNGMSILYSMRWDEELEKIAQRWADQCIDAEDVCRNVDRFLVRQRFHVEKGTTRDDALIFHIISRWTNEDRSSILENLAFKDPSIKAVEIASANFYNQLLRQNENKIGCGAVRSSNGTSYNLYFVCNYGIEE